MRAISFGILGVCLIGLAGCSSPTTVAPTQAQARLPPQDFAPGLAQDTHPANEAMLTNDPSAPRNTPLCGAVQQETNRLSAQVFGDSLASGSSCPQNACFDPLTGTFIAANGERSVCR